MTQVFLECTCPTGHIVATGDHHPDCTHTDIDAKVACPPGSDCCAEDHDHAAMANSCHGNHEDVACPEPAGKCTVWRGAIADAHHPLFEPGSHPLFSGKEPPPCPGGHCHVSIPDCAVCRPLIITMLPGSAEVTLAGQVG
jgi:hypothetical protein